jgi:glycosyltransferase involved in cell wall biosynthesis
LPLKYIVYVGNRGRYKNFIWFLRSIADYLKANDLNLVCAGGGNFTEYEVDLLHEISLQNKVFFVDFNTDDELKVIYQNAAAMVFPSLLEGFGIPILEAFSCKCPVILINTACFREVAGSAALYFEPNDSDALIEHLESIQNDHALSARLKEDGLKRLELFSWEKTINEHIKVYSSFNASLANNS